MNESPESDNKTMYRHLQMYLVLLPKFVFLT